MVKKKKELNPIMEKRSTNNISDNDLKGIAESIKQNTITSKINEDDSDSFYKNVVNKLFDDKDISTKTEYLNVRENFVGAKLEFYAKYGNIPYLKFFIQELETKRVSLERKGRKEILMALQERKQEIEQQRLNNLRGLFGV